MTNQAGECAPLGAAHGNEIDTKDAGFVIMVGLVALLLLVAFACGAFFSCWCLGGSGPGNNVAGSFGNGLEDGCDVGSVFEIMILGLSSN